MVARYGVENGSLRIDRPRIWAERAPTLRTSLGNRMYALHPDGVRVAVATPSEDDTAAQNHLTFVLNFFDELRRIAPAKP